MLAPGVASPSGWQLTVASGLAVQEAAVRQPRLTGGQCVEWLCGHLLVVTAYLMICYGIYSFMLTPIKVGGLVDWWFSFVLGGCPPFSL